MYLVTIYLILAVPINLAEEELLDGPPWPVSRTQVICLPLSLSLHEERFHLNYSWTLHSVSLSQSEEVRKVLKELLAS